MKVALLSKWHVHAEDYAQQVEENPNLSIEVIWDEDEARGRKWAEEKGVRFEAGLDSVLSDGEVDGVVVCTPTTMHKDVMTRAAQHKKHIYTEKVLGLTIQECDEIFTAVKENGVRLVVSLPRLKDPYYLYAEKAVNEGWLGKLTAFRCRLAHNGAVPSKDHPEGWLPAHFYNEKESGGGSLIDLGAHPIYLANRFGGIPETVSGSLHQVRGLGVDDQAAVIVEYNSGLLATLETGFVSGASPFQMELYGTEGSLLVEDQKVRISSPHVFDGKTTEVTDLPENGLMPIEQWRLAVEEGQTPYITDEDAIYLTSVNEAAAESSKTGKKVWIKHSAEINK